MAGSTWRLLLIGCVALTGVISNLGFPVYRMEQTPLSTELCTLGYAPTAAAVIHVPVRKEQLIRKIGALASVSLSRRGGPRLFLCSGPS